MDLALGAPTPDWDALVRRHSARVFRLAYRLTGNRADAEDLTQEVFVRALRGTPAAATAHHEGWFHRVTTNLVVDQLRRRGGVRSTSLDARPWVLEPVDDAADPSTLAVRDELAPDVAAALAALPPEHREAVVLRDVHGYTYAEIGVLVGARSGTVRSRIHRGRAQLRAALSHRAPPPGRRRHGGPHEE